MLDSCNTKEDIMGKTFLPEGTKGVKPVFNKRKKDAVKIAPSTKNSTHVYADGLTSGYKATGIIILTIFVSIGLSMLVRGVV